MAVRALSFILTFFVSALPAQAELSKDQRLDQEFRAEEMADACSRAHQKDKICGMILQIRQIGADAVEYAKEYLNLSPREYAVLTAANSLATGRIRMQTSAPYFSDSSVALDIKRSEAQLMFLKSF